MINKIVEKPWGVFINIFQDGNTTLKILDVAPNCRLSLQSHKNRDEIWTVLEGTPIIEVGDKKAEANMFDTIKINRGEKHRLSGGENGCKIIEVSLGDFSEEDIVRYEDDYGRISD